MLTGQPLSIRQPEPEMTILHRALAGLIVGAIGTLFAAGVYAEAHRAPDQS
jgi:hypothetical protein